MKTAVQWVWTIAFLLQVRSRGASLSVPAFVDFSKSRSALTAGPTFHEQNSHRKHRSIPKDHQKINYFVTVKDLEVYLEPTDHSLLGEDTPVYLASGDRSQPLGIHYRKITKEEIIDNDLAIKALPSRSRDSPLERLLHFAHKKKENRDDIFSRYQDWLVSSTTVVPPRKPQFPPIEKKVNVVYPELLVIVDYETYLAHNESLQALTSYMAAFWNAVDLRFRAMSEPKVRLNIAATIVATDEDGAPYVTRHRLGKQHLRDEETLNEVGKYLRRDERWYAKRNQYDIVVAITNLDLCTTEADGCNPSVLGRAQVGNACKHHTEHESFDGLPVAVVEDHGSFGGVLTAAHEIGHLLGVEHDGEDSDDGPGAKNCDGEDGHLMSPSLRSSSDAFHWSRCSVEQMRFFLKNKGECLRNKPVVKEQPVDKMLPGQLMSRDEQCRITFGTGECKGVGEDECGYLHCRAPSGWSGNDCIVSTSPPAEGSSCGDEGRCLDGLCTHTIEL